MTGNAAQQHDLNPTAAAQVVRHAGMRQGDTVLEVGAGTGALTAPLLAGGATVIAVERDLNRVVKLEKRFASQIAAGQLILHAGDVLKLPLALPATWTVIANPPFNLTADLVRAWLLAAKPPHAITLVLQAEAARKLTGAPGMHTRSSTLAALAGRTGIAAEIPRDATSPPSRVDLALWSFRRHPQAKPADLVLVDRLLTVAFAGPHTVQDALRGIASSIQLRRQGAENHWQPTAHPREIPPPAWLPLAKLLHLCGKLP